MKRADEKLINQVIDAYWSYLSILKEHNEIAQRGATQEGKMYECKGVFPQLSNVKPDILSSKADLMALFTVQEGHLEAAQAIHLALSQFLPKNRAKVAGAILLHRRVRLQNNPKTRQCYTHRDCARELGISFECYKILRERGMDALLVQCQMLSTRYAA